MDDDEFFEFCAGKPKLRIERCASGEIIIKPPAGAETAYRNSDLTAQLTVWAKRDGRGRAFDSNTEYILPNGAALSPDASWVLKSRLDTFSKEQKKRFLPLCPDFVVELTSPTDRLNKVKAKMREWIENGAALGRFGRRRRVGKRVQQDGVDEREHRRGCSMRTGERSTSIARGRSPTDWQISIT